jgi:hypothetical protein
MSENMIYDYYERISDRYYVARIFTSEKMLHLWQPLAKKIILRGFDDFDIFIYKENKCFMICEGLTGAVILRQTDLPMRAQRRSKCLRDIIDPFSRELLRRGGRPFLNQTIVNFLVDQDQQISGRYKPKAV